jgi:L,D-peptidoglycan transpeptidase YkuD (ErfK/YbiS/YcfS/YnhG family)
VSVFPRAPIASRSAAAGGESVVLACLPGHRSSSTTSTSVGWHSALVRRRRPRALRPLRHARTLGQLGLALLSLPFAVPAAADPATYPADQPAQWIVVGVPAANATTGVLTAFQRVSQQWKAVLGPIPAKVGALGVGAPADGVHRTPVGTFTFDQAFGRQPNPGTKMPYFQATDQDWWDEDAGSRTYNTHVRGSGSPSSIAENLYDSGPVYDYAVNIAVNPQRIPGRVAGIFLHVTDGSPTWGCVAIGHDEMRSVLNWLDPSASPKITIGVGNPSLVPSGS